MSDASYCRDEYIEQVHPWLAVRSACEGERAVKKLPGVLPLLNGADKSPQNVARNASYLQRAVWFNATGRTRDGLIGLAFSKDPDVDFGKFDYLADNADGEGRSIYHLAQEGLSGVLETARHGFLTDMVNDRPSIVAYKAEDIINWRVENIDGRKRLVLLVLREWVQDETDSDQWSISYVERYRVYRIVNNVVTLEIHQYRGQGADSKSPTKAARELTITTLPLELPSTVMRNLKEIPFAVAGAKTNSIAQIDTAPLLGLADMNYAHFRDSADYQDSVFFCGQVQPYMTGLDIEWRDRLIEEGLYVGSRTPMLLPSGGTFGFAQAQPNTLVKEAMDKKESLMVALGARVVEQGQITKTATQAAGDIATGTSVLGLCAGNVSEALTRALQWCGLFESAKPFTGAKFSITQKYDEMVLDPQKLNAVVQGWQAGAYPVADLRVYLKRVGVLAPERTDAEMDAELEVEDKQKLENLAATTALTKPAPAPAPAAKPAPAK